VASRGFCVVLALVGSVSCTGQASPPVVDRTPSPPAARAAVSVMPATHLRPAQRVEVSISGFPAGAKVRLSQCALGSDANPHGCGDQLTLQPLMVTDQRGAAETAFMLRGLAAVGPARQPSVPCRYTCVLVASTGGAANPVVGVAPLRFAAPASAVGVARLRVRPMTGLRNGQRITVDVTRFLPGEKVWFSECAPGQRPTLFAGCGDQAADELFAVTDDRGSRQGTRFRVAFNVRGRPCRPSCVIAAIGDRELATVRIRFR
jgi:hypothetical protein